jgi:outer membrane protein OmpA-like peptidoglycan-associated protein
LVAGGVWSPFRNYTFNANSDDILRSDGDKAREIADYLAQNPTYRVGLDGADERRINRVRDALTAAGVPASKIEMGAFGDPQIRSDGQVAVLISR